MTGDSSYSENTEEIAGAIAAEAIRGGMALNGENGSVSDSVSSTSSLDVSSDGGQGSLYITENEEGEVKETTISLISSVGHDLKEERSYTYDEHFIVEFSMDVKFDTPDSTIDKSTSAEIFYPI